MEILIIKQNVHANKNKEQFLAILVWQRMLTLSDMARLLQTHTLTTKNLVVTNFGPKSMTITLQHKKFDKSGYSRITVVTFLKITVVTFYLPMVLTFVTTKS